MRISLSIAEFPTHFALELSLHGLRLDVLAGKRRANDGVSCAVSVGYCDVTFVTATVVKLLSHFVSPPCHVLLI